MSELLNSSLFSTISHVFSFLSKAPSSLLEALEQHLASLEGKKTKELNADTR